VAPQRELHGLNWLFFFAADPQASPHFLRDIKESISRMAIPEGIVEPG